MPGLILHTGAVVQCAHGIPAQIPPVQPRVLVSGQPVATSATQMLVAGCPFTASGKAQPCVTIRWLMPAARVQVLGQPVLLQPAPGPGAGLCQSPEQIPNGPPMVSTLQARVLAT